MDSLDWENYQICEILDEETSKEYFLNDNLFLVNPSQYGKIGVRIWFLTYCQWTFLSKYVH